MQTKAAFPERTRLKEELAWRSMSSMKAGGWCGWALRSGWHLQQNVESIVNCILGRNSRVGQSEVSRYSHGTWRQKAKRSWQLSYAARATAITNLDISDHWNRGKITLQRNRFTPRSLYSNASTLLKSKYVHNTVCKQPCFGSLYRWHGGGESYAGAEIAQYEKTPSQRTAIIQHQRFHNPTS